MQASIYHIIIYTPEQNANAVRQAAADAGAGHIGNYDSCSFSLQGTGRFRPLNNANPYIGSAEQLEEVSEEKIELLVSDACIQNVLQAIVDTHPYEEPAIHVLPMLDYKQFLEDRSTNFKF